MAASKKNVLVVNVLFWVVAALLHPLATVVLWTMVEREVPTRTS